MAASDYMRMNSDQIRPYVNKSFYSLGTDGFGRSDTRPNLRRFFEIDSQHITLAALSSLVKSGEISNKVFDKAISDLGVSKERNDITAI